MIDDLINRIKEMYHQLERDEQRFQRRTVENSLFGVLPDGAPPEEEPVVEPSPSPSGAPPAEAPPGFHQMPDGSMMPGPPMNQPEVPESLLDVIGRTRGNF